MIQLNNVTKYFGKDFKAVDGVTLHFEKGKIYGFLGPNGAGKTTALKMMSGILTPDEGEILINGIDICKEPTKAKKEFGFVSDDPDVFLKLKGIEYLNFVGKMYGVESNKIRANILEYSKIFKIDNVLFDKIETYSHGMRQKLSLVAALIHEPKIWLLDEPLTGLDPKSAYILKEMMREHADKGYVVLFSTHILEVAEKICDVVAVIDKGKIIFKGTIKEMKKKSGVDKSLEKMFLELVDNE